MRCGRWIAVDMPSEIQVVKRVPPPGLRSCVISGNMWDLYAAAVVGSDWPFLSIAASDATPPLARGNFPGNRVQLPENTLVFYCVKKGPPPAGACHAGEFRFTLPGERHLYFGTHRWEEKLRIATPLCDVHVVAQWGSEFAVRVYVVEKLEGDLCLCEAHPVQPG